VKRMGRWAFNILAVVSLVLCSGSVVLLVRSYWKIDKFEVARERKYSLASCRGVMSLHQSWNEFRGHDLDPGWRELPMGVLRSSSQRWSFQWTVRKANRYWNDGNAFGAFNGWTGDAGAGGWEISCFRIVYVPHVVLVVGTALPPLFAAWVWRRRWRRLPAGMCKIAPPLSAVLSAAMYL
jgi:hypothetical protein